MTRFFLINALIFTQESEDCLLWNDPDLKIDWGINEPILSEKDQHGKKFSSFVSKFK